MFTGGLLRLESRYRFTRFWTMIEVMKLFYQNRVHRRIGALLGLFLLTLLIGCSRPVPATVEMMDHAEARWQADPIANYHIVVDVSRPAPSSGSGQGERRRSEVTVHRGDIAEATVRYWDSKEERWGESYELNQAQAFPFTVPGLYEMVRGAIQDSGRVDVRVEMEREPAFPHRIVMGPVWQDDRPVPGTEAVVSVHEFKVLD